MKDDVLDKTVELFAAGISEDILESFEDLRTGSEDELVKSVLQRLEQHELPQIAGFLKKLGVHIEHYQSAAMPENRKELHKKLKKFVSLNRDSVSKETLADGVGLAIAQHLFDK